MIATRDGAILRATRDGAVWITHVKRADDGAPRSSCRRRSRSADRLADVPGCAARAGGAVAYPTWRPIRYEEDGAGRLPAFPVLQRRDGHGAVRGACARAYAYAQSRPTRVIVLMGGPDFWSNGIHLNLIEAAAHPADESWRNINAIDDLVRDDRRRPTAQLTIAAMQGNAGAGGVFLALAADHVCARDGVILNPHYKAMGNLYGSEYWTYLLPRRVAPDAARARRRRPLADRRARARRPMGLIDAHFGATPASVSAPRSQRRAAALADDPAFRRACSPRRNERRAADEAREAARSVPRRGARADEAQLLRLRLELSRRALQLRAQGAALAHAALSRRTSAS